MALKCNPKQVWRFIFETLSKYGHSFAPRNKYAPSFAPLNKYGHSFSPLNEYGHSFSPGSRTRSDSVFVEAYKLKITAQRNFSVNFCWDLLSGDFLNQDFHHPPHFSYPKYVSFMFQNIPFFSFFSVFDTLFTIRTYSAQSRKTTLFT